MIVYLAGENAEAWKKRNFFNFNRLASFHYIKDESTMINKFNRFILDSGAFSFITSLKNKLGKLCY
jgi:predicted transcriptional regulator